MNTPKIAFFMLAASLCGGLVTAQANSESDYKNTQEMQLNEDAYVLESIAPRYPEDMLLRGIQGRTILKLKVSESGDVEAVHVVASTNKSFSKEAVKTVQHWYFEPGKRDGVPIAQTVMVPVDFIIEDLAKVSMASL